MTDAHDLDAFLTAIRSQHDRDPAAWHRRMLEPPRTRSTACEFCGLPWDAPETPRPPTESPVEPLTGAEAPLVRPGDRYGHLSAYERHMLALEACRLAAEIDDGDRWQAIADELDPDAWEDVRR